MDWDQYYRGAELTHDIVSSAPPQPEKTEHTHNFRVQGGMTNTVFTGTDIANADFCRLVESTMQLCIKHSVACNKQCGSCQYDIQQFGIENVQAVRNKVLNDNEMFKRGAPIGFGIILLIVALGGLVMWAFARNDEVEPWRQYDRAIEERYGVSPFSRKPDATNKALSVAGTYKVYDADNDGVINCVDYAYLFWKAYTAKYGKDTCRFIEYRSEKKGQLTGYRSVNHVFNMYWDADIKRWEYFDAGLMEVGLDNIIKYVATPWGFQMEKWKVYDPEYTLQYWDITTQWFWGVAP
jgi:hypothetical protein